MTLAYPHAIWLLLLIPLLLIARQRWGRGPAAWPFSDVSLWSEPGTTRAPRRDWGAGLRWTALIIALLACTQPRWPDRAAPLPVQGRAVQIVLDVSGSMGEVDFLRDGKPISRLQAAKDWLKPMFVSEDAELKRADDLLGLITFATQVEEVCPPTLSHRAVADLLAWAEPVGHIPDNTTNIGDALLAAIERCRQAEPREKVILLLSDGEHNVAPEQVPGAWTPQQAAQLAGVLGIRIHTLFITGLRSQETPELKAQQAAVRASLQDVARRTGGLAFAVEEESAWRQIASAIGALEASRFTSHSFILHADLYPWLLALSAILLAAALVHDEAVRRVLP